MLIGSAATVLVAAGVFAFVAQANAQGGTLPTPVPTMTQTVEATVMPTPDVTTPAPVTTTAPPVTPTTVPTTAPAPKPTVKPVPAPTAATPGAAPHAMTEQPKVVITPTTPGAPLLIPGDDLSRVTDNGAPMVAPTP